MLELHCMHIGIYDNHYIITISSATFLLDRLLVLVSTGLIALVNWNNSKIPHWYITIRWQIATLQIQFISIDCIRKYIRISNSIYDWI